MARRLRLNHPGIPFHVTARTQGREPLFRGMEAGVVALIERHSAAHRLQLIAYAVMPNHLHLLIVQGAQPLGELMQRLLRHIALRVLLRHGREGHVFERRYYAAPCTDPLYFRNAVAYIHLNAVRAGICSGPGDYEWTSHALYTGARSASGTLIEVAAANALQVFSEVQEATLEASRAAYARFLEWRLLADAHVCAGGLPGDFGAPRVPIATAGDDSWFAQYGTAVVGAPQAPSRRADLRDVVQSALTQLAPDLPLDHLREGGRSRQLVRVRRLVIARCLAAGHAPGRVARFLGVSTTTVSRSQPA